MEELEDYELDRKYPRRYGPVRAITWIAMVLTSIVIWLSIALMLFGCSPIITSPHGYVILTNSHRIAVEHERMDKPGYGVVRLYEFPFGHEYKIGSYFRIPSTPHQQNEPSKMVDKNN